MDTLTFSDLRRIQKNERNSQELTELDENFILQANEYLQRKEENGGQREYKSSKRVYNKIIALREQKVVDNARMALRSNIKASELNLLPREKELFRETKDLFEKHRDRLKENDTTTSTTEPQNTERKQKTEQLKNLTDKPENNSETQKPENNDTEPQNRESESTEEGYQKIKITSQVPEFMGTDLESYGPFEEGDEPVIPEDNAEILINRGNAEET